jgi:serine/threonine-protein kinase
VGVSPPAERSSSSVTAASRSESIWRALRDASSSRLVWLTLVVGLIGTAAFAGGSAKRARQAAQREFAARSSVAAAQVQQSFSAPLEALHTIHALATAWPTIDQARFERFAAKLLERYPSLAALELFDAVRGEDRTIFERRMSAQLGHPFSFRDPDPAGSAHMVVAPQRDLHVVLTRLMPHQPQLHGLDLMFDPLRRVQVAVATHASGPWVTSKFRLVEDPQGVYSVAVYEALFADGEVPKTAEERERKLVGFATALYRLSPLMKAALSGTTLNQGAVALIDQDPTLSAADALLFGTRNPAADPSFRQRYPMRFAGRAWALEAYAEPPPILAAALPSFAIGGAGSLLATFLVAVSLMLRRSRQRFRALEALGPYTLERELGAGGMGRVFEARHRLLRRRVAIKVIAQPVANEPSRRRFELEAKITSELSHPNTVTVFDYGHTGAGDFYYAMEYVNGIDFEQLVRRFGAQSPARVRHLLAQVCGALSEAHGLGLVHRDIKPGNLMVAVHGGIFDFVKVLDFGLVRVTHGDDAFASSRGLLGTPRYMAPEAFASAQSGPRADLYALGCVAYFLLSGREPFAGKTDASTAALHLTQKPAPLVGGEVSRAFEDIVMRCLSKSPDDRFASAAQMMRALNALDLPSWTQADAAAFWADFEAQRPS